MLTESSSTTGVCVGVGEDIGIGNCDVEGVGVGTIVGLGEGVTVEVGVETTLTPLLQTSFFPDLIHVYLMPFTFVVKFNFEQESPALTAA